MAVAYAGSMASAVVTRPFAIVVVDLTA